MNNRIILISGPSGEGKETVILRVRKHCGSRLEQVKVRKTQTEKHTGNEDDLGFYRNDSDFIRFYCRETEQRLYYRDIKNSFQICNRVIVEGYRTLLEPLKEKLKDRYKNQIEFLSVFISPLDRWELKDLKTEQNLRQYLEPIMLDSIKIRAQKQGKELTDSLLMELNKRAKDAPDEVLYAHNYDWVIPNHCFESDVRWSLEQIVGEPDKVVSCLSQLVMHGEALGPIKPYAIPGSDYTL